MYSRQQLADGFRSLGVKAGDSIMLHASVRAVGDIAGGPDQIHLALKDVLTSDGTLIMYAGCPRYYDEVGRGNLDASEEQEVLEKLPAFDAVTARSARDHGVLVEFFRTYPGPRQRSRHAVCGVGTARGPLDLGTAVGLRIWRRFRDAPVRRNRREDPAARCGPRHRHVPSLRRAHRRLSRQTDRSVSGAHARRQGRTSVARAGRGGLGQRGARALARSILREADRHVSDESAARGRLRRQRSELSVLCCAASSRLPCP